MAAKKKPGTALANWDEQLAKDAEIAAAQEASALGGGKFFSFKAGVLAFNGNPMPDNQMPVIVLDAVMENAFYEEEFDPENPAPPDCYAFGRSETAIEPHEKAEDKQADRCATCPRNEWGSAEKGRGKACKNQRRLAVIPAGTFENGKFKAYTKPEQFQNSPIAYMRLPVMSVKGWAQYTDQLNKALKKPTYAVFTKVKVQPDPQSQFRVVFEPLGEISGEFAAVVMERRRQAMAEIEFPYPPKSEVEERRSPKSGKGKKVKGKRY